MRRPPTSLKLALLPLAVLALLSTLGFREEELECEEATKHLIDCCPEYAFDEHACTRLGGCSGEEPDAEALPPTLTVEESKCIRDKECDAVRAEGICERAMAVQSEGLGREPGGQDLPPNREAVCR